MRFWLPAVLSIRRVLRNLAWEAVPGCSSFLEDVSTLVARPSPLFQIMDRAIVCSFRSNLLFPLAVSLALELTPTRLLEL